MPKLITFYNGTDEREDRVPLRLSDAFPEGADIREADIEVTVTMLNINHGRNRELMEACEPLAEYSWFINEIRQNQASGMDIEAAVNKAIDAMPDEYVIKMFLIENRAEVEQMCITEYDEAETIRMFQKEAFEEGHSEGWSEGRVQMIIELGREDGLDDAVILRRIQEKAGLSLEEAADCLREYEKQKA